MSVASASRGYFPAVNFARDVVDAAPAERLALVELARDGARREWTLRRGRASAPRGSPGTLAAHGVGRGDVVMTLIGNRPDWVLAMVACFRIGAVVLPCTEQLRAKDLRLRLDAARPALVARRRAQRATSWRRPGRRAASLTIPDEALYAAEPAPAVELDAARPVPDHVHERHGRRAEGRRCTRSATWPASACRPSTGSTRAPGDLVWCTAASGWSKSARNVFIAPWIRGAAALLHDARFDPHERLELLRARARERAVHGADRVPRDRQARRAAAGRRPARAGRRRRGAEPGGAARVARGDRPVDPRRLRPDRDRPADRRAARRAGPARLDGPPAAGREAVDRATASWSPTRRTVPTFFLRLPRRARSTPARDAVAHRRPRRAQDDDGFLYFEGRDRRRDHLRRLPHRPVRGRVGARRAPGRRRGGGRRGARRRARRDRARGRRAARRRRRPATRSPRELQEHVKATTAPYKYPRRVDFAAELPKTASGKVRRALLREQG